jgi:hypothetical protein
MVRCRVMEEDVAELFVVSFAHVVMPLVHGVGKGITFSRGFGS